MGKKGYYRDKNHAKKEESKKNRLNQVRNLIDIHYYERAIYKICQYIADYPNDTTGHYLYGKLLLRTNKLQSARREFQYVIECQDENEVKARMLLAAVARLEGDPDEAISQYKKVIEDSDYTDIYAINVLAHLQRKEKRYQEAMDTLSSTDSDAYELQVERVKNLSLLGRFDEALSIIELITPTTREQSREIAINKGRLAKKDNDYEKADFYYEIAKENAEKDDIYYRAVYEQIKLALENDKYEVAENYCQELISAGILFKGEIHLFLGLAEQAQKKYDDAYKNYKLSAQTAEDKDVRSQANYQAGSLEFAQGHLHQAEVSFKISESTARIPTKEIYTKLIAVLYRQRKYDEAKKYLARAKKKNSKWVEPDTPLSYIDLLIDKQKGNRLPKKENATYAESQIIKYDENAALKHIESQHQKGPKGQTKGKFSAEVYIPTLFYDIKNNGLIWQNRVNEDAMDIYEIDLPNAGYDMSNNLVHRVRVVVFPQTRKILTMYPGAKATVPRQGEYPKQQAKQKNKVDDKKRREGQRNLQGNKK